MTFPDLSFIEEGRKLEVEAIDGGRALSEFTLAPDRGLELEDQEILGTPVDDVIEREERIPLVTNYLEHARTAFGQRGLIYPFQSAVDGSSLEIVPGCEELANELADLSFIVGQGKSSAKRFEKLAFSALHTLVGGWGVCVGAPRVDRTGPGRAVKRFRDLIQPWESGNYNRAIHARSGDYGSDGFIVLGRSWGGPIVYFQAKNSGFQLSAYAEELARIPEILNDWFGGYLNRRRLVIPVCALNTIMTIEMKERLFMARGDSGFHLLDAADVVAATNSHPDHDLRRNQCLLF